MCLASYGSNAMPDPKYTPNSFKIAYAPLKAEGLTPGQIASQMKISKKTLGRYLKNPDYVLDVSTETQLEKRAAMKAENHSDKILETAYKLHEKGIHDALFDTIDGKDYIKAHPDYKAARQISIDALKIARTEAEIKRVFLAVGQMNIDNRQVNITQIRNEIMQEVWDDMLCVECKRKIKEARKCPKVERRRKTRAEVAE